MGMPRDTDRKKNPHLSSSWSPHLGLLILASSRPPPELTLIGSNWIRRKKPRKNRGPSSPKIGHVNVSDKKKL